MTHNYYHYHKAQFQIAFPKSWNEGTITFQAYWTTTATDTDGVAWGLQGVAVSDNDTIDVAYGTTMWTVILMVW